MGSSRIFLLHGAARYRGGASSHSSDRCREDICRYHGLLLDRAAISAITFTFGPLFGSVLKEGVRYFEKEEDRVKDKLEQKNSEPKTHSC